MRRRDLLLSAAVLASDAARAQAAAPAAAGGPSALATPSAAPAPAPAVCALCRAGLPTLAALRERLPAGWTAALEPEPELGGEMLVVRAGRAGAPPLLLVHGLGQNGFNDWMPVLPALARRFRVVAVDLPGFGWSPEPSAKLSPTHLARALGRLLDREGRDDWIVAGHSLGGAVALRLAELRPRRVARLVLVDVAGVLHRTAFSKHILAVPLRVEGLPAPLKEPAARLRDLGRALVEQFLGIGTDPTEVLRANEWLWPLALRDRVSIHAALALVDEDFTALLRQLALPVHVIWGEADPIAPLRTGELLARRLRRAQLWALPGVGHEPMAQATVEFQAILERALIDPPRPREALPSAAGGGPAADLELVGEVDRRIVGRWREIRLERCSTIRLVDVHAERIVLRQSSVQMTGGGVHADGLAVDAVESEFEATACDIEGRTAIRADAARLDLAGVRLRASGFALQARRRSRLVASVCEVHDAMNQGGLHADRTLEQELLNLRPRPRAGTSS